jgi:hypothetical protein
MLNAVEQNRDVRGVALISWVSSSLAAFTRQTQRAF